MTLQVDPILHHLGISAEAPSIRLLDRILKSWSERIPWETASRIARHQVVCAPVDYAWLPETFFQNAIEKGTGGTCFESNLALHALLKTLGFEVTLHFCDMETGTINPHCTVLAHLNGRRYLADVGFPVPAALVLDGTSSTVTTPVYDFNARPDGHERWVVNRTSGNFRSLCFWVKGQPIDQDIFHQRLVRDHEPDGLFLKEVIIQKAIDGAMWRYSDDKGLVKRTVGIAAPMPLPADKAQALHVQFGLDQGIIEGALAFSAAN